LRRNGKTKRSDQKNKDYFSHIFLVETVEKIAYLALLTNIIRRIAQNAEHFSLDNIFSDDYSFSWKLKRMIDDIDRQILNIIQQDARISNAEIARQVGLAASAVLERIRKLEERKIIRGYSTEIDAAAVGYGLTAFVAVRTHECCDETDAFLAEIPEVLEVHDVAGEDSYLLKVRVRDTEDLSRLLRRKLKNVPNVASTKTTVVLGTIKEKTALPLTNFDDNPSAEKTRRGKK
jgi:Lrp/AsnC family leucine-responsive transcriptional regulator